MIIIFKQCKIRILTYKELKRGCFGALPGAFVLKNQDGNKNDVIYLTHTKMRHYKALTAKKGGLINARNRIKWVENRPLWGVFRPFLIT